MLVRHGSLIFVILCIFANVAQATDINNMTLKAINERTQPVGQVYINDTATTTSATSNSPRTGKAIYEAHCVACHGSGAAGAPKLGDKAAWQPRIAKGMNTMLEHAIKGYNLMPAKGTCMDCTDEELKNAINYMIAEAQGDTKK